MPHRGQTLGETESTAQVQRFKREVFEVGELVVVALGRVVATIIRSASPCPASTRNSSS